VKIIETDKSENKQVKAGQKTMNNFMKTSNRPSAIQRTPPTPTEASSSSSCSVRFSSSTLSCALMFGSGTVYHSMTLLIA
jgi:hypothetical protein